MKKGIILEINGIDITNIFGDPEEVQKGDNLLDLISIDSEEKSRFLSNTFMKNSINEDGTTDVITNQISNLEESFLKFNSIKGDKLKNKYTEHSSFYNESQLRFDSILENFN